VLIITTGQIVNVCGVILAGGLTFEVDGTARELASKMGWKESLEL
jgi:hypothetical protein